MNNCKCGGSWRTDGQHSNEFCARCFTSRPRDPYNTADAPGPKPGDVVEWKVPEDTIEVIVI